MIPLMQCIISARRKLRLAHARELIKGGVDYLTVAYECGFESASGFRDAFEKMYGLPPGEYYAGTLHRVQKF